MMLQSFTVQHFLHIQCSLSFSFFHKQPPDVFYKKDVLKKFREILKKTCFYWTSPVAVSVLYVACLYEYKRVFLIIFDYISTNWQF